MMTYIEPRSSFLISTLECELAQLSELRGPDIDSEPFRVFLHNNTNHIFPLSRNILCGQA